MTALVSMTLEDAAKNCGYSVKTLREAIKAGSLIAHRQTKAPNSKLVVEVEDLRDYIKSLPLANDVDSAA